MIESVAAHSHTTQRVKSSTTLRLDRSDILVG